MIKEKECGGNPHRRNNNFEYFSRVTSLRREAVFARAVLIPTPQ